MKIQNQYSYLNYKTNQKVSFGSASDITLSYVLKNHSRFLPKTMLDQITSMVQRGENMPLYELHSKVYRGLFESKSLDEAKSQYEEFKEVKDVITLANNRSKAIKAILKLMPLEKFTLGYLKKLYQPISQEELVKEYGFTNRNLFLWLNSKLNIQKLSGSYLQLLKMSNEEENTRIAELSRRAIYANPLVQQMRCAKAAETHRTLEYRTKKRQEMKDFYIRHPEAAERTSMISKKTWDKCPEIKTALSDYTRGLSSYVKKVLSKKLSGAILTESERKITFGYYRGFWEQHPEMKSIYQQRRLEAIEELKEELN